MFSTLLRLAALRRSAGGSHLASLRWAAGLVWRNEQTARRRRHLDRRAEVERAARQRL
ncbi:hypothetical protein [Ottowia testudinis]|nr:hypothetical protein [Ottowia testudinis]